jgi:ADP-ribosylglycohydrolase
MPHPDAIRGAIYGLLVGDALGVPYEFRWPDSIPPMDAIEMQPPAGFARSHSQVPVGTWSDDGAQALCLLASLLECGRMDVDDLGRRLVRWQNEGYLAVDQDVFDIGIGTSAALRRIAAGTSAAAAGGEADSENGNGSLMRILPLALWHRGSDAELVHDAQLQSLPTHRHPRSQVCCALYCLWARRIIEGSSDPWFGAVDFMETHSAKNERMLAELEFHVRPREPYACKGTGYVVDALRSAESSYEAVVRRAIALGHDTDTTACIAGGIAGLMYGVDSIPQRWMVQLRGKELVEPLLHQLVGHAR